MDEWDRCHIDAGDKAVIVYFSAVWCGPCKDIGPEFETLAGKCDSVIFVKVDVDENEEIAKACEVIPMPTFQVFKNGKKIDEFSGIDPAKLTALVEKYT